MISPVPVDPKGDSLSWRWLGAPVSLLSAEQAYTFCPANQSLRNLGLLPA